MILLIRMTVLKVRVSVGTKIRLNNVISRDLANFAVGKQIVYEKDSYFRRGHASSCNPGL